jgi:hypothetical protein
MALTHSPSIVRNGLVLHLDAANTKSYPGSGTIWTDLSSRGNNGTLTNGPAYTSSNNGSIVFDGINDFVTLGAPAGYLANIGTVIFWMNPTNSTSNTVFMQYANDSNRMRLTHDTSRIVAFSGFSSTDLSFTSATNSVPVNSWTHVSYTYNFSANSFALYINGILSSSVIDTDVPDIGAIGEITLGCAKDFDNPSPYYAGFYTGRLANFLCYNRVLTDIEIRQNFEAHRDRYGI